MPFTFKIFVFLLTAHLFSAVVYGQQTVTGTVFDASTSLPLPYATIARIGTLHGTTSDSDGVFELSFVAVSATDSLEISYIGFRSERKSVRDIQLSKEILLTPSPELLDIVIVRPLQPSEYLKIVQRSLKKNTAQHSFNSISHYEEKITENGRTIGHNEGVFKSWQSAYSAGADIQHQLALYRREDIQQLEFMKKKAEKEKKKYLKKNPDEENKFEEGQLFINDFGGPKSIQQLNLYSKNIFVLDSTKHKHFYFKYLPETIYMGSVLTVISYESKGKVDDRRFIGTIYIDQSTDAVVWIKESGRLIIPILIKPILFAFGIEISSISYAMELKMRPIDSRWYPQFTHWDVIIDIKKNHLFGKNEKARFRIEQELETSELLTEAVLKIPESKLFDAKKKMSEQVFPILGIGW